MKEAQELSEATEQYYAQPLEDNLFEWHFTIRGPSDTDFSGGIYHGRIVLPPEYPMKPPSIILLTPNGRFETNKKICLSISGHHPESWQPSWSIRTALLAIIGFMPTHGAGAIGSLDYPPEERKKLANRSKEWKCPTCGIINYILKPMTEESEESKKTSEEAKELASQINFQAEKKPGDNATAANQETTPSSPTNDQTQSNPQSPTNFANPVFNNGFPFPPPMMGMPNFPSFLPFQMPPGGGGGSATVPRFPPPPPFIPGMFPPGPQNAFMQQWQMNPFMMGRFPVPPSMMFSGQMPPSPLSQLTTNSPPQATQASTQIPQPQPLATKPPTSTQSVRPQTAPSSSEPTKVENITSTSSSANNESSEGMDSTASPDISPPGSENSNQEPQKSSSSIQSSTDTSSSQPQQSTNVPTGQRSNEGLRQRLVEDDGSNVQYRAPVGRVGQSAEIVDHQHRRSGLSVANLMVFFIGLAIAILLIRRFFLSRNWKFYYGV